MDSIGLRILGKDRAGLLRDVASVVVEHGGNMVSVNHTSGMDAELVLDVVGLDDLEATLAELRAIEDVVLVERTESVGAVFGKRVIVIGGGAQVAQVVLGAVSEADRHNIRGERISVDTIPLVGEARLAEAVRAVARLPRARILVLAGSLMGGEITNAVRELQEDRHIPVISLAMVGSVTDVADLVVSDPVQAGVMAVMAIADTAKFSIERVKGKRL